MKAVTIYTYGGTEVLTYGETSQPIAGEGEVLIKVHATTVNPFDCGVRAGYMQGWFDYALPLILGLDVSGVIEKLGAEVTNFKVGDEVFARADVGKNGAYAQYVTAKASEVAAKPKSLNHLEAAAIPHAALTAWRVLVDGANLRAGQRVLIHGAAGGVGHFAVQLAKGQGAYVIGTCSAQNVDFLRELGVDEVIDYNATPFETVVNDVDVVLDTIGGEVQERSWSVLKPGGILISLVQPPSEETAVSHGVRQLFVNAGQQDATLLTEFARLADAGQIKPTIAKVFPLQEVQQAHILSQGRHTRGKIVLEVMH